VKRTFWLALFSRHVIVPSPLKVSFLCYTTQPSSAQREKSEPIGITKSINNGRDKAGRLRSHTVCGILIRSSLAVTIEGVPLG